ncbi:response regulator [bacterium]|nr:response regulator [candidate division CSSED10-310 bacterium]
MKILFADDDPKIHTIVDLWLNRQGHHIEHSTNGADAFGQLQKISYDLLITDVNMPEINGIELVRKSQELETAPKFVILMTSRCDIDELQDQIGRNNVFLCNKPFSPATLADMIQDLDK